MLLYTTWGDGGAVEVGVVVVFTHRCWTTIWEKVPRPHLCKREMWVKFYILPWIISGCITRKPSRPSFILCVPYVVLMSCLHYYAVVSWFFLTLPFCWHLVQDSIVGLVPAYSILLVNEPVIFGMRLSLPEATNSVCVLIVWYIMSILGTCRADHPSLSQLKMSCKMILLQEWQVV